MTAERNTPEHKLAPSLTKDIACGTSGAVQDLSQDAELIRLCDRIVEINVEEKEIDGCSDDPDNDPIYGPRLDVLTAEYHQIKSRIEELTITTLAGANAVASATMPEARKQLAGHLEPTDLHEELAMMLVEFHAVENADMIKQPLRIRDAQEAQFLRAVREMEPVQRHALATFLKEHADGVPAYPSAYRFAKIMGHDTKTADELAQRWAATTQDKSP